jgi:hypothetical protein
MTASNDYDPFDTGDSLELTRISRRQTQTGGTWVRGRLQGCRFEALVFPEHPDDPGWELGSSRISKLWLQRLADRRTVFHWDRGPDVAAADAGVQTVVDFLAGGLAEFIYRGHQATPPAKKEEIIGLN